jgi:Domain of unknown function (DUF4105)
MSTYLSKKYIYFFIFFSSISGFSQFIKLSENAKISVLTIGLADESHSLYGHTAIRVNDPSNGIDLVYNYGMFDFNTEYFILKFVKGDMQYFAISYPYQDFENSYHEENRSIYEQNLNISTSEKQLLYDKLNAVIYSDERFYTYKFIDRNCTTKVMDILNDVLVNKPIIKKNIETRTYREVLFPFVKNHFFMKLGINIIFGTKVDEKANKLFLPLDLMENLKKTKYNNQNLVSGTKTNFEAKRETNTSIFDSIYFLSFILLIFVVLNKKNTTIFYFLIFGIIGLLFSAIGLYSFHEEVLWNYNILLFNPMLLILVFFMIKKNVIWIKKISMFCLLCIGIYVIYMFNKVHLYIMIPLILSTSILLLRNRNRLLPTIK